MIDIGLQEGQNFPTPAHRTVAENLIIANAAIENADRLSKVVQYVITISASEIETIELAEMPEDIQEIVTQKP